MQRKLASVQKVLSINPIANADAIELAKINGWQCVVKKGDFEVGDLGIFFEIDAVPPDREEYQFLWRPNDLEAGVSFDRPSKFRIRTLKLRGALSQGLFMPVSTIGETTFELVEGEDLTEFLSVEKYEPQVSMGSFARSSFPYFVPKTDEARVQSVPAVLDEMTGRSYEITLKYDGTSSTFCIDPSNEQFHCCSRNYSVSEGANVYWDIAKKYDLERLLRKYLSFAIQGEICGPGIQGNPLGLSELKLFVFGIYDIVNTDYLNQSNAYQFCFDNELPFVDIVESGDCFSHTQDSLLQLAEGKYPGTSNEREGVVIRPIENFESLALGGRMSFKAISNRFLLKSN